MAALPFLRWLPLFFVVGLTGCQPTSDAPISRIAVISAFNAELAPLLAQTINPTTETINGVIFTTGTLARREVVLFQTDVGIVNTAMNTQLVLDHYDITGIIFSGIGGGLLPDSQIGDVIIPEQWAQYQSVVYARQNPDGTLISPAWLTPASQLSYDISLPMPVTLHGKSITWFPTFVNFTLSDTLVLKRCLASDTCLTRAPRLTIGGSGVSGQGYIDNLDFGTYLHTAFSASVVDMESAAVAQVAYVHHLPLTVVRGISDLPGITTEAEMQTYYPLAVDNAALVTLALLASDAISTP